MNYSMENGYLSEFNFDISNHNHNPITFSSD